MVGKAYTYTLCGVIKDYQVNWDICNRNRFPTGIVTKAGAERIGSPLESHMLIRADKGDSVYEDLKKSDKLTCGMEENARWNQDVVKQMPYIGFLQAIRVVIAVAAACVLYQMCIRDRRYSISNTAEYGDYITGPKVVTAETKKAMKQILKDIQDGSFAKEFLLDMSAAGGQAHFKAMRKLASEHPSEKVGEEIRKLYSLSLIHI